MKSSRAALITPASCFAEQDIDLAGALHEVSNALTVVLGWLDVAYQKLPPGTERAAIEVARTHARLGYRVAREAIGAEPPDPELDERPARALAENALLGAKPRAESRGVRVVLGAGCDVANGLVGDASSALQILMNLLLNAIDFSPRGGTVTLTLREKGDGVVFGVSDQGPGVDPDRLANLLIEPVSTRPGGAGLGLRYSMALARSHGGELCCLGRGAPGACFELLWPAIEFCSSAHPRLDPEPNTQGLRVLLLEDDAAVCSLVELALEARGAQVIAVSSREQLKTLLKGTAQFDAALIDLSPLADEARGLLDNLRAHNPNVSVVLISGVASGVPDEIADRVDAWVRKPFEMGEVLAVLAQASRVKARLSSD